jgi:hypothetical protein
MAELKSGARRKIHCNTCKAETNHELQDVHVRFWQEDDEPYMVGGYLAAMPYWEKTEYRFWACLGCDTALLEEAFTALEAETQDGDQIWKSTYHPQRMHRDLPEKPFRRLDPRLVAVYREVIESFNAGLTIICAMGLRALLEGVCVDRGITDEKSWGLERKLGELGKELEENGYLPADTDIVECLLGLKFIGDDAAHRLDVPSDEELRLAIEVMEDLLNFVYQIEYKQRALRARRLAESRSNQVAELQKKRGK